MNDKRIETLFESNLWASPGLLFQSQKGSKRHVTEHIFHFLIKQDIDNWLV